MRSQYIYWSVHEISVLMAYAQMPLIKAHAVVSGEERGLIFDLSLYIYRLKSKAKESAQKLDLIAISCSEQGIIRQLIIKLFSC